VAAGSAVVAMAPANPAAAAPTSFNAITPYRTWDSRQVPGARLNSFDGYYIDVYTDVFGSAVIPSSAAAVTYNLTVVGTGGQGYLTMWPANVGNPGVSNINWFGGGQILANGGTVALGANPNNGSPGWVAVQCGTGQTDFIIDITGYFA
jgi:hypothetical protein